MSSGLLPIACATVSLLFGAFATAGPIQPADKNEQLALTGHVLQILNTKCADCHGPQLARPKGRFGYVLDLERIANNPDYIVRGQPEESEFFLMIQNDEMPTEDSDVPPLTSEEKAAIKQWIEIGAPSELPPLQGAMARAQSDPESAKGSTPDVSTESVAKPPVEGASAARPALPLWKRFAKWVGKFHPVTTHFPVALMFVALFAEGIAWRTRQSNWLQTVRFLVVLAGASAVLAGTLGWINAAFGTYVGESAQILGWHRWLGTFTVVWAILCAILIIAHECPEGSPQRQRFRGALVVGAFLVGISGFLGSALIYGLDHYAWH